MLCSFLVMKCEGFCATHPTTPQNTSAFGDPTFATYLTKEQAEGKHYNVAPSHAAKKVGSTDLRYGEVPTAIPHSRITVFLSYT